MNWPWKIVEFSIDFFEMIISCYFAFQIFNSDHDKRKFVKTKLFVFSLVGTAIQYASEQKLLPIPDLIPVVLTFLLYAVVACHSKVVPAILWSLINCLVLGMTTISISSVISLSLHTAVENLFSYSGNRVMFLVINKIGQLMITEVIIRVVKREKYYASRASYALIFVSLFSIIALLLLWKLEYTQTEGILLYFNLFICMLLLCMNFSLMFFLSFAAKAVEEKRTLKLQNKLTAMQLRGQREIAELYSSMRSLKHDMNTHLHTIHGYIQLKEFEKADQYMQRLIDSIQAVTPFDTGNITLDALLGSKVDFARRHQIDIQVEASVPKELSILEDHISVVMGNLLDNAMDACLRINDHEKRYINAKVLYISQNLLIRIENSTNGQERRVGNDWLTTKEVQTEHGYGLQSIDRIVRIYGGFCQREHTGNVFVSQVRIPDCRPDEIEHLTT